MFVWKYVVKLLWFYYIMYMYTTKCTWLGKEYGCRIFRDGILVVEGRAKDQMEIGAVFRDLFRTLDTLGGDEFTKAVRYRKHKPGNLSMGVKHYWNGKIDRNSRQSS